MNKARSSTQRPIGPIDIFMCESLLSIRVGIEVWTPCRVCRSGVGLNPYAPHQVEGILIDPPRSDAMPIGEHRELTSPPSPPELPPTVRPSSHGFLARPHI